ncbi:Cellulose synthase [Quillaja saponaria]|uniref:Cellulose synthase n=1 Tax=Quillaja saponaria TaxID=32244 RepID=A0AAD7PJQ0_QUISA|nr:Cellulose synthase [Quillaja saponaria]
MNIFHTCTVQQPRATLNRIHSLTHFLVILVLFYYRITRLLLFTGDFQVSRFPWILMTISEFILAFIWLLTQPFRWRPVSRSVIPENIPKDINFPSVDVFICTTDPKKEPTVEVMNTVLSAMALDYPTEKLAVYLSDDGGSAVTFYAIKEACAFAKLWIPFCIKYGIKSRCPQAFFSKLSDNERLPRSEEFVAEEEEVKVNYEEFKRNVEIFAEQEENSRVVHDRSPHVEIIHSNWNIRENNEDQADLPLLVYVSREKRPSHHHRFKAGALNTLLRVSGILSNGPYILVLDCDMYCNDPTSARQAMCFHLDPQLSQNLAFVQFPQIFYNISTNDIYDAQVRSAFKTKWQGMDGIRGPIFSGTGFYLKRKAMYGNPNQDDNLLLESYKKFGMSGEFIESLKLINEQDVARKKKSLYAFLQEATLLASCSHETNTRWGKEIGFSYDCLLESTFTGYLLHCRGWTSVYLYPKRPCFLGCCPTDMKDAMIQHTKWMSEPFLVGISRFTPLLYGVSRMSILQSMCYGYFTSTPILWFPMFLYGTLPQLCLLKGIPLFPKVWDPWFAVFAAIFLSSLFQHLIEVLSSDGSIKTWWNEQRSWLIKSVSANLFGVMGAILKRLGMETKFSLSNKAMDKEKLEKYEKGKFDFQGAAMFMVPLSCLVILNTLCFFGGLWRVIIVKNIQDMFGQLFLSAFILVFSYPILEGMLTRVSKKIV